MKQGITLIVPRLSGWIAQLAVEDRFPALETLLARADTAPPLADHLDPLRMKLFGCEQFAEVPVAAFSRLACGSSLGDSFAGSGMAYVRMDPAILQADLNRVVLMHTGFGGFPASYQREVRLIVEQVLAAEGQAAEHDALGWVLPLSDDPDLRFVSVDEALGADIADCLPQGPAAQNWKRLQNEIQIALHASAVNQARRQAGAAVINSVWFWGNGALPSISAERPFDRVYAEGPVSLGLAKLHGCDWQALLPSADVFADIQGQSILLDWAIPMGYPQATEPAMRTATAQACTPHTLNALCAVALAQLKRQGGVLELHTPERSWYLNARQLWRIWQRPRPLRQQLIAPLDSLASPS